MLSGFDSNFSRDDEDVLNEFRQKQVNFDLEERKNEINNSRSLFIGALAGLAMAGIVGWFVLAPQYRSSIPEEVPVIRKPQSPVKVQPLEPGNVDISNQEKTVYDILERKGEEKDNEKVLPTAEQPNIEAIETLIEEAAVLNAPNDTAKVKVESLTEPQKSSSGEEKRITEEVKVIEKTDSKPEVKQPEIKKPEAKPITKATVSKTTPKGAWQIQLMSSPNRSAVENSWTPMAKKYSILANQPYEVETADLGKKGTYYRLRAGNFATKDAAAQFCNKLKSAGGSCFVARK